MTVMCLLLFVLPVSKKKIVDAGWVRVEFGQSGADGAPDFLGFGAFPWFSRFEVICKGGSRPRDRILCKIWTIFWIFSVFPWFSRFEVICKGGGAGLGTGFSAKSGLQTGAGQSSGS